MSSVEYETAAPTGGPPYNTPPALIAFILGILVVCFVAFSIAYLCKYCFSSVIHTWAFQRTASGSLIRLTPHTSPPRGLDPSLLQVFPTFPYSSVKDLRKEKYSLECAICLLEFEDDSMLRLLTLCCHVFHQDCIDLWLRSNKTCPVCRRDLDSPAADEMLKSGAGVVGEEAVASDAVSPSSGGEVHIDVREGRKEGGGGGDGANDGNKKHEESEGGHDEELNHQQGEQMFVRSHSTGHSIVMIRGEGDEGKDDEKYTLKLPEHVLKVRQNKHNCTRSCASYKDMTTTVAPVPCSNCGFVQPLSTECSSPGQSQKSWNTLHVLDFSLFSKRFR